MKVQKCLDAKGDFSTPSPNLARLKWKIDPTRRCREINDSDHGAASGGSAHVVQHLIHREAGPIGLPVVPFFQPGGGVDSEDRLAAS